MSYALYQSFSKINIFWEIGEVKLNFMHHWKRWDRKHSTSRLCAHFMDFMRRTYCELVTWDWIIYRDIKAFFINMGISVTPCSTDSFHILFNDVQKQHELFSLKYIEILFMFREVEEIGTKVEAWSQYWYITFIWRNWIHKESNSELSVSLPRSDLSTSESLWLRISSSTNACVQFCHFTICLFREKWKGCVFDSNITLGN